LSPEIYSFRPGEIKENGQNDLNPAEFASKLSFGKPNQAESRF